MSTFIKGETRCFNFCCAITALIYDKKETNIFGVKVNDMAK